MQNSINSLIFEREVGNFMKLGCLIMAAGNGSRFGENKLAAQYNGKSLIEWTLDAVPIGAFEDIVVVTQYNEVEQLAINRGLSVLRNHHPEWGVSHTIALGTTHLKDCDGIMYLVSDQPLLDGSTIKLVAETWRAHPSFIIGAAHNGKRGNPCVFPKNFFAALMALEGDNGGNVIINKNLQKLKLVEVPKGAKDVGVVPPLLHQ